MMETILMLGEYREKGQVITFLKPCEFISVFHWHAQLVIRMKYFDQRTHKQVKENQNNWIKISAIQFECSL